MVGGSGACFESVVEQRNDSSVLWWRRRNITTASRAIRPTPDSAPITAPAIIPADVVLPDAGRIEDAVGDVMVTVGRPDVDCDTREDEAAGSCGVLSYGYEVDQSISILWSIHANVVQF